MPLKSQIRTAVERLQAKNLTRMDKYFSTMTSVVSKLPGERLTKIAVKALDAQQEATHKMLDRQARMQNVWLRERAKTTASD